MATATIRHGGVDTPHGYLFELKGNAPLDLTNTLDERGEPQPRELLRDYANLVQWAQQSSLVTEKEASNLIRVAGRNPADASAALRRAKALRAALFDLFHPVGCGKTVEPLALVRFEDWLRQAMRRRRLQPTAQGAEWVWTTGAADLDRMLWPTIIAALDLLTSPEVSRIRCCHGPTCEWLFLDHSQKGNRRWCDMTVCGNRAKAKRHYSRVLASL